MEGGSYVDDCTILDEAELWRRIPLNCNWIVQDDNMGTLRVSSAAFNDSRDGSPLSVQLADVVTESGRTAEDVLAAYPGYTMAAITAGNARSNKQGVARTPTPDEPAHASVFGKKTGAVKSGLAKSARWVIPPPGSYGGDS